MLTPSYFLSCLGENVKSLMIGKLRKLRCFRGISTDKLPVIYMANKSALMTIDMYEEWLLYFNRTMSGRKVLLFVDNAPTHSNNKLMNVTVKYLLTDTTSYLQPMDHGIIQSLKLKYRRKQLQRAISAM